MDADTPSPQDPDDQVDPASPMPEDDTSSVEEQPDQDAEPTMNAPDEVRPDGLRTEQPATGDDGAPA